MNLKICLQIASILLFFFPSGAHEPINLTPRWENITPEILITDDLTLTIDDIRSPKNQKTFSYNDKIKLIIPDNVYWYKIDFSKTRITWDEHWLVRFRNYDEIILFYQNGDSISYQKKGKKWKKESRYTFSTDFELTKENLIDGNLLYARVIHDKRALLYWNVVYTNPIAYELSNTVYTKKKFKEQLFYYLFIGALFFIIVYFWGIYFMYKDKLYILYLLFLMSLFLYLAPKAELINQYTYVYFEFFFRIFHELIQGAIHIFYLLFASAFFKAKTNFPKLYVAIRNMVKILLLIMTVQLVVMCSGRYYYLSGYIMQGERILVILFSFWAYYYILKHYKDRMVFFLLTGSFFYLLGGLSAMIFAQVGYMMLGALLEVFLFSLGMGYRMKKIEDEKKQIENEMIKVELSALKAQMNPHFIFNSLNSIRAFVISSETKKASDYITKFSKLIRLILYYSSRENITLREEIDALTLYVQLEGLRYREVLGFEVNVDPTLNPDRILVPPLILQPYIENAIRHGLAPKNGEKFVRLSIIPFDHLIEFRIKDNGVGRQFSNKSTTRPEDHISMAMELTRRRIHLTEILPSKEEKIMINDLFENSAPAGTEVIIRLPLIVSRQKDEKK